MAKKAKKRKANTLAKKKKFFYRHFRLKRLVIILVVIIVVVGGLFTYHKIVEHRAQNALNPFYNTAGLSTNGPMGQVVRSEPLGVSVANGYGLRVIYRTQRQNGSVTFSSGMVFIPNNSNSGTPRPVVAWAHGTVGMGTACAPSRGNDPTSQMEWLSDMLGRGWVVTATDYAGLGTPGIEGYLIGGDESRDVLNSVRAAEDIPAAQAGSTFAVWGHSQGGNSALFTAADVSSYAPELNLVGTVASAPAAELIPLMQQYSGSSLEWVIGPEIMVSFPTVFANLNIETALSSNAYNNYKRIANQCIIPAALGAVVRTSLKQTFFKAPLQVTSPLAQAAQSESAPILSPSQPLLVAESTSDNVVFPDTTALYIQQSCKQNADITQLWLSDVGHVQLSNTIGPQVVNWIGDRFAGKPTAPTCNQPTPVAPYVSPS